MNVDLKFDVGNRVLINGEEKNNIGEIICCKVEKSKFNDQIRFTIRYQVKRTPYSQPWYEESQLTFADDMEIKVSPETDKFLMEWLLRNEIDRHLTLRDFDTVAELTRQLNDLHRGEVTE